MLKLYKNFYFEGHEVNQPFGKKDRSVPHGAEIQSGAPLVRAVMGKKTRTGTGRRTILQLSPPGPNRSATGAAREDGVASGSEGGRERDQYSKRINSSVLESDAQNMELDETILRQNTVWKTGLFSKLVGLHLQHLTIHNKNMTFVLLWYKLHCLVITYTLCGSGRTF